MSSFEDLNADSITDARTALAKRTAQMREKRILDMLLGTDLIFDELTEWYLDLSDVKKFRSYNSIVSVLKSYNSEFGNYIVNAVLPEDLKRY